MLTALLRLANSGRIQGFYGRLGDLGTIDQKYDVAIYGSTRVRLDGRGDCRDSTACIEYLRKTNWGMQTLFV